jgi:hypothetical protein
LQRRETVVIDFAASEVEGNQPGAVPEDAAAHQQIRRPRETEVKLAKQRESFAVPWKRKKKKKRREIEREKK